MPTIGMQTDQIIAGRARAGLEQPPTTSLPSACRTTAWTSRPTSGGLKLVSMLPLLFKRAM